MSVLRREVREAGLTLIFDAKKANPQPQFYKALMTFQVRCTGTSDSKLAAADQGSVVLQINQVFNLQELMAQAVNSVVLLVDKESSHRPERCPSIQVRPSTLYNPNDNTL